MTTTHPSANDSGLNLDHLEALANDWPLRNVDFQKATNPAAVLELIALARRAALANQPAPTEHPVLELLLGIARLAHDAMDNTEDDGDALKWNRPDFDALSDAMDKLDALPDDQPGYVMGPAAKAEWAMRANQPAPTVPALDDLMTYPSPHGTLVRLADVKCRAAHQPAQEQAEPFSPTDQQYADWCDRHDLPPHQSRDAFDDAASLYLAAQQELVAAPQQAESRKKAAVVGWEQRINAVAPALRVKTKEQAMEAEIAAWRELAHQQAAAPEQFCDANCVWTDHHKECTISAPGTPEAPKPTCMTEEQAEKWAWAQVKLDVGTDGWTVGDSCTYFGFFLWGWRYCAQYERQRDAAPKGGA